MNGGTGPGLGATQLRIIRMALLAGVIVFGIVATVVTAKGGGQASDPDGLRVLTYVQMAFIVTAAPLLLFLQRRHAAERDPARAGTLNIVAWAVGESVALFGGVLWLLTGSPTPYLVGLAVMVASFVLVPIRE